MHSQTHSMSARLTSSSLLYQTLKCVLSTSHHQEAKRNPLRVWMGRQEKACLTLHLFKLHTHWTNRLELTLTDLPKIFLAFLCPRLHTQRPAVTLPLHLTQTVTLAHNLLLTGNQCLEVAIMTTPTMLTTDPTMLTSLSKFKWTPREHLRRWMLPESRVKSRHWLQLQGSVMVQIYVVDMKHTREGEIHMVLNPAITPTQFLDGLIYSHLPPSMDTDKQNPTNWQQTYNQPHNTNMPLAFLNSLGFQFHILHMILIP